MKAFLSRENMANDWNKIGILAEDHRSAEFIITQ